MGSRKDILKNLGIPEYPWSSDEDEPPTDPRPPPNSHTRNIEEDELPTDPRPPPNSHTRSVGQQGASSSAVPLSREARNQQSRDLFMSLVNACPRNSTANNGNPTNERLNYRNHNDGGITYLSRATHTPAPELRERPNERADLDIQRVLAFKRLTRTVANSLRYPRYSMPRGLARPGAVVPSEGNPGCVRLPYYRRVNRNIPTNNIPGSARQIVVDQHARTSSAPPLRRRTYNMVQNSDDEPNEAAPSTSRNAPHPATAPAPAAESPLEPDDEPEVQVATNNGTGSGSSSGSNSGAGSGVALAEDIVEIVDEPTTAGMGQIDRARAVLPSSSDPNLASTSRSDEVDAMDLERSNHGVKRKRRDSADDKPIDQITVKVFNQSLLRLLECPVCLEWMEPPMSQCRRGHLVCNRCRTRLVSCPVCRTTFSSVRNRAMEGVAEMLRYPCRHGCGREVRLRNRSPHEASCAARKYLCPAPLCIDRLPLPRDQLAEHFRSRHLHLVKLGARHHFGVKVNTETHENWIIMALDEFFHMKLDVDIRTWGVIVYIAYIGPKCNAMDFAYEVTVEGQHSSRKMSYKRATHSDLESSSLNVSRQDCFHLTLDQALNFIRFKNRFDSEKYLEFDVDISRIDPPPSREESDS